MLFNSLQFCVFLVVVTALYYRLPWRGRWPLLLAASCLFYMSFIPAYILILFATIGIDYALALRIARAQGPRRRHLLTLSVISTCAVLFVFKYYNFFAATTQQAHRYLDVPASLPMAAIILPIGLSFHTFQSLAYVVEVYRGRQAPERHFGIYALYVMFFPQLVAGPIERPQNLLHQFYEHHVFDLDGFTRGLLLIGWGYFQKMVIADRAAVYVNNVYGSWPTQSGLALLLATALFAVQIYADFAGYSAIAIGCARLLGFDLMRNFRHPYFARSLAEFWGRWHISLSTWFRDYLYIPLGGNRVGDGRLAFNLLVTFAISGLWHGANWTFVAWGVYHGLLIVCEKGLAAWLGPTRRLWSSLRSALTLVLVGVGWVLFRAPSLGAALAILRRMALGTRISRASVADALLQVNARNTALGVLATTVAFIALMFAIEAVTERGLWQLPQRLLAAPRWQMVGLVALFEVIMLFGVLRASAFIYFQF